MSAPSPVTCTVDADGIAWIILDDPASRANLLNPGTFSALGEVLGRLEAGLAAPAPAVKAAVIVSAKERIFSAGADLKWLAALPDAAAATRVAREGRALFGRIAILSVPVVAAIHGACAGGGYELALACTLRLATDAPETRIGLPETGLGLIPGWGGCTRLARLIGAQPAAEIILNAALIPANAALAAGMIDAVVPPGDLKAQAKAAALRLVSGDLPKRPSPPPPAAGFFAKKREAVSLRWRGQPARLAALGLLEQDSDSALPAALEREASVFGELAAGVVAANLIRRFQLRERAGKITLDGWFPATEASPSPSPPLPFRTVGIVGAGTMGSGIAHWCAARGFGVIMCDSDRAAVGTGVGIIRGLFADGVARGKVSADDAHRMTGGVGISTSLEDFEFCDLVIEAVVEDRETKRKVFAELSRIVGPECVVVSNSSALPIAEVAADLADAGRLLELHFLNPVSRLPLVEISPGARTSRATAERVLAFVRALGRVPLISRSSPGGFVNRVLFFYLNEACRLWEEGAGTDAVDRAMTDWGWPKGPMRLIDEIGADVTAAVFGEFAHCYSGRFVATAICPSMVKAGLTGRKSGAGFYEYDGEGERLNPAMAKFAPESPGGSPAATAEAVQERLNGVLAAEVRRALAEGVVGTPEDAELALALGLGFPVFRKSLVGDAP